MSTEKRVFNKLFKPKTNLSKKGKLKAMLDSLDTAMQKSRRKRIDVL